MALSAPLKIHLRPRGEKSQGKKLRTASARWNCSVTRGEGTEFFSGKTIPAWTFTVAATALLGATVRKAEKAFGPEMLFNADIRRNSSPPTQPDSTRCRTRMWSATATGRFSPPGSSIPRGTWTHRFPHFPRPCSGWRGPGTRRTETSRSLEFVAEPDPRGPFSGKMERSFLREVLRLLEKADPDLLVTEYGDDWLLPRLLALASRLRVSSSSGAGPRNGTARRAIRSDAQRSGRTSPTAAWSSLPRLTRSPGVRTWTHATPSSSGRRASRG